MSRPGPAADIRAALERVGIPRMRFQLAQLTGRTDDHDFGSAISHMVVRGELDVVPNSLPKLYRLPVKKVEKIHIVPDGPFRVATEIPAAQHGYRWWTRSGRLV